MDFSKLKQEVYEANMLLQKHNLVVSTWGNVSQKSECGQYFAIKPSGVQYDKLKTEDIVIVDMEGNKIEGELKPSIDTPIHLAFYKEWKEVKAVCHTHSPYAVSFASEGTGIECYSTVHADNFYGTIPVTREMTKEEIDDFDNFEANTAKIIIEKLQGKDPMATPAALARSHGPFMWSNKNAAKVVELAVILEELAKIAHYTRTLNPTQETTPQYIQDIHYRRKHGPDATYGQGDDK